MRQIRSEMLGAASLACKADSPWFALRVWSGREEAVEKSLLEAGIEALVPMRKGREYRRRGRVIPAQMIPVMTGYVLVQCLRSEQAFLGLLGVEHVISVIGGCETPLPIHNEEVQRFKTKACEGAYDWEVPAGLFKRGMKVRIGQGPFAGITGEIVSCRDDGRGDAVVEAQMFGAMTPLLVPLAILEKP
ncbi:transcription termination/antitermination NusG family protein [Sinorhizobium sp. BG8]|uniref:transcription termination/antitermination protein NusG n=1 Tax=Sinorhizobium sp. BG8 TaxID=2613773 RepID=UPI00193CCA3F|nr:transcription termination/antitermination NusG family protein [Sinorhizobium sp. BG8]